MHLNDTTPNSQQLARIDLYARVSTGQQRIENQIEAAHNWLAGPGRDYTLGEVYPDNAQSGTIPFAERPAGKRLLADIRAGEVTTVLVWEFERLGRDNDVGDIDTRQAIIDIERAGARIISIRQPVDDSTSMGKLQRGLYIDLGTMERRTTLERSSEQMVALASVPNYSPGGRVLYGYAVEGRGRASRLVIDDEPLPEVDISPAEVVRLIYRWIADERRPARWVAYQLQARGIPTKRQIDIQRKLDVDEGELDEDTIAKLKQRAATCRWHQGTISDMIHNMTYKGIARYGNRKTGKSPFPVPVTERPVPAIVDPGLWERAHTALRRNRAFAKRNSHREYLLRGLVKCGKCGRGYAGAAYIVQSGEERHWYSCNDRMTIRAHDDHCPNPPLGWQYEGMIWADIDGWMEDPGDAIQDLQAQISAEAMEADEVTAAIAERQRDLASAEGQRQRLLGAYRKGIITDAELESELTAVRQEVTVLEDEIRALEHSAERIEARRAQLVTARSLLDELREKKNREGLTFAVKRQVIETLVREIIVHPDGTPEVVYQFERPTSVIMETDRRSCC